MIELGSGRLVPGFEEQLAGATAGDERTVTVTFPDDYGAEELAGKRGRVRRHGQGGQGEGAAGGRRRARDRGRLRHARRAARRHPRAAAEGEERRIEAEFREAVLDSAVANATVDVPDALVEARARELWDQMLHSLSHQGISKEMYLQISGRSEEEIVDRGQGRRRAPAQARGGARRGRRRRVDRADRGRGARGARGGRAVRAHEREEAARADEVRRPPRRVQGRARAAQGARPAGRVRDRRSRSSRRRRATSSGPPAPTPRSARQQLWTPGS